MASILKRNNIWQACYYVDGKPVRKSTGVHVSPRPGDNMTARELKKLAASTADGMEAAAKGNISIKQALAAVIAASGGKHRQGVSFADFADHFLDLRREKSPSTYNTSSVTIRAWKRLMPDTLHLPLHAITPAMCQDFAMKHLDEVSGATVHRHVNDLSAMFNRAIAERLIESNPAKSIKLPYWAEGDTQTRDIFSTQDIKKMMLRFPGEWPDMIAVCLLLGGQRLGDIATLRWEQIDMEYLLVKITTQKTNRPMRKPITPPLAQILDRRRQLYGGGSPFVFPYAAARYAESGGKTSKLSIEFNNLLYKHGIINKRTEELRGTRRHRISEKSFHSLRATAVTYLLAAGTPSEMVRHIVGHDTAEIERQHYFKPRLSDEASHIVKLGDALLPGASSTEDNPCL